jgi:hypothetical protein
MSADEVAVAADVAIVGFEPRESAAVSGIDEPPLEVSGQ